MKIFFVSTEPGSCNAAAVGLGARDKRAAVQEEHAGHATNQRFPVAWLHRDG
jgi:hypothetical protein